MDDEQRQQPTHRQYQQEPNNNRSKSNIPVPDPSVLTTAALEREVGHLRELFGGQIDDIAMDLERFKASHGDRHSDTVDTAITHLKELTGEKFSGVNRQFAERDLRFHQRDEAADEAIKAALSAAKEAVAKSEATFTKEIDGLKALITSQGKATDQTIRDIKDELASTRGKGAGMDKAWGIGIAIIGILIAVISLMVRFGGGP